MKTNKKSFLLKLVLSVVCVVTFTLGFTLLGDFNTNTQIALAAENTGKAIISGNFTTTAGAWTAGGDTSSNLIPTPNKPNYSADAGADKTNWQNNWNDVMVPAGWGSSWISGDDDSLQVYKPENSVRQWAIRPVEAGGEDSNACLGGAGSAPSKYTGGVSYTVELSSADKALANNGNLKTNVEAWFFRQESKDYHHAITVEFFRADGGQIGSANQKKWSAVIFGGSADGYLERSYTGIVVPAETQFIRYWFSNNGSGNKRKSVADMEAYLVNTYSHNEHTLTDGVCECGYAVYDLWVGGVRVTNENEQDILSGDNAGKVSFIPANDVENATLTLNGANIAVGSTNGFTNTTYSNILSEVTGGLTIKFSGNNAVTLPSATQNVNSVSIMCTGDLTLDGEEGALLSATVEANTNTTANCGIMSIGKLTIKSGAVEAIAAQTADVYNYLSVGVYAGGAFSIEGGSLYASGESYAVFTTTAPTLAQNYTATGSGLSNQTTGLVEAINVNKTSFYAYQTGGWDAKTIVINDQQTSAPAGHTHGDVTYDQKLGGNKGDFGSPDNRLYGNYYLESDCVILDNNGCYYVGPGDTVNLCLNGHTFDLGFFYIEVRAGGTLNICDCGSGGAINSSNENGVILNDGGNLNINSGAINGTKYGVNNTNSGIFNLNGGSVTVTNASGSGIYNRVSGTVNVTGGTVSGGQYGIRNFNSVSGPINVSGGTISGIDYGIYNYSSSDVTVTGGNISGETAIMIYQVNSKLFVSGNDTVITGTEHGIFVDNSNAHKAILYLFGAPKVSGTTADIYVSDNEPFYAHSNDTTPIPYSGDEISINFSSYGDDNPIVKGVTSENKDKFTSAKSDYSLMAGEGENANDLILHSHYYTIKGFDQVNHWKECSCGAIDSATVNAHSWTNTTCSCGLHSHDDGATTFIPLTQQMLDSVVSIPAGSYYLSNNLTATKNLNVASTASVTLCLNGNTLNLDEFTVTNLGTLTVCDCIASTGKVTSSVIGHQNGVIINHGTLIFSSGRVQNVNAESNASCAIYNTGALSISGGKIISSSQSYGVIDSVGETASVIMTGGEISNSKNSGNGIHNTKGLVEISGGSIRCSGESSNALSNGDGIAKISGGTLSGTQSSIYVTNNTKTAKIYLSGTPTISSIWHNDYLAEIYAHAYSNESNVYNGGNVAIYLDDMPFDKPIVNNVTSANKDKFSEGFGNHIMLLGTGDNANDLFLHAHAYSYLATNNVLNETCSCGHSAQATISKPTGNDYIYDGSTNFKAKVSYSSKWKGGTLTISYSRGDSATTDYVSAGTIVASITKDSKTATVTYTIAKISVNKPVADDTVFTYTGAVQTYNIEANSLYAISNNTRTDAGTQQVIVSLLDKNNYEWAGETSDDLTFEFKINPKEVVIVWSPDDFTYNGQDQKTEITAYSLDVNNGTIYLTVIKPDEFKNYNESGYEFSVELPHGVTNYKLPSVVTKTYNIKKATYDMSGVTFNNGVFTYDGTAKSISISGTLPTGVEVNYTGNGVTNATASAVTVTATFTGDSVNYNAIADMTATITVNKANLDMSGITFTDSTVVYNGESHSLAISGNLPNGVTVEYDNNGKIDVGVYTITANFTYDTANYNQLAPMTATLIINQDKVVDHVGEQTADAPNVEVTTDNGFAPNVEIVITEIDIENAETGDSLQANEKVDAVYDITLKQDGVAIQPNGTIIIKLLIPTHLTNKEFRIIHNHQGTFTQVEYSIQANYAVFSVDNLSEFLLVTEKEATVTPPTNNTPVDDGSNLNWLIWLIVILAVVLVAGGTLLYIRNKKLKNKDIDNNQDDNADEEQTTDNE